MVILKSRDEIQVMREAGRVVARTLAAVTAAVRPGVSLRELDALGEETIRSHGATPSFLGYHPHFAPSPFPASLCLSPNEVIVHGIPDSWALVTRDGSRSAHFEHTVAITAEGPRVLTLP